MASNISNIGKITKFDGSTRVSITLPTKEILQGQVVGKATDNLPGTGALLIILLDNLYKGHKALIFPEINITIL